MRHIVSALFIILVLVPEAAAADTVGGSSSPQPYARVRVSIPSSGGRAEIRETASSSPDETIATLTGGDESGVAVAEPSEQKKVLASLYGRDITDEDVVRELLERRGRETLEWMIGRDILKWELERLKLEVSDAEVDERLQKHLEGFRKAFPGISRPEDLTRATSGMRLDEYRERSVWVELALRKIMRVALKPTNEQLRGYYAERQADFIKPERVKISQVFIAPQSDPEDEGIATTENWAIAERQILEAHSRLRLGEEFVDVARAYGSGGQLSRWAGRGELLRELEEAAFGIGVGSTSAPIRTSMGFHIVLVEEKVQRKVPPYEEVKDEVLAQFEERQFVMLAGEFMSRLRDKALKNGGLVIPPKAENFPAEIEPTKMDGE